ncbi:MAG: hypothetical protein IKA31_00785, partial [Clostridia bacterium]|nr:hypothetical protein [Clostridia bacterium]
ASLSSNIDVQSEVQKLGVQILKSNGETYNYDSKLKPYNYGDVKYLAYYQITNGNDYLTFEEYNALSSEEKTPYTISYISEIDYNALLDAERSSYNEILIGEAEYDALSDNSVKNTFTAFYFVQLHNTNVDLSSWKFNFESANSYRIRFKFFSTDSSITIADKYVDVTVLANISLPVDFTNIDPIKLTIDYTKAEGEGPQEPEEPENPQEPQEPAVQNSVYNADVKEYNVSIYNSQSNINIPEENEYTDVRYFVFVDKVVEEDETTGIGDLTQYINAIKTNNKRELGGNFVNLYEIENGILKFKADNLDKIKDVTFYVSFATVKKDINGSIIYTYEDDVYSYDIDQHSSRYIQVSIIDTLKDVEVSATVDEDRLDVDFFEIKDIQNDSSYYAFLQNKQNVINVEIKAVDENQIELLKEEITNGNIQIVARSGQSNVTDQILSIVKQNGDEEDTSVKFNISTKLLTGSDQKFALFVVYTRNNKNYDVKIGEISVYEVFSGKATEVHFGKEVVSGEGEEQTTTNFGELIQAERQNSNPIKVTVSFSEGLEGTTITTSYKLVKNGEDVIGEDLLKSFLFDKDGNLIFTFNDKYGRQVESGTFSLESSNTEVMTVSENNIAF